RGFQRQRIQRFTQRETGDLPVIQNAVVDADIVDEAVEATFRAPSSTNAQRILKYGPSVTERTIQRVELHFHLGGLAVDAHMNAFRHSRSGVGDGEVVP